MTNLKEMKLVDYRRSIIEMKQEGPATRLRSACGSKGSRGESRWPALCAAIAMIGMACTGSVEESLNLRPIFAPLGFGGNVNAENYTFGSGAIFIRTTKKGESLTPDYERVLSGCNPEDSMENFILHLYQFVEQGHRQVFRWAAREAFGIRIPADMKVTC